LRAGSPAGTAVDSVPPVFLERWRDRIAASIVLGCFYLGSYFTIGIHARDGFDLMTGLDQAIPFWPLAVFVYASAYPVILAPLFLIRDPALFRHIWIGYALSIGVCDVFFWAWPVSSLPLRAPVADPTGGSFADWGIQLIYALDPPRNCFPSLHLALAATGVFAVGRASRTLGRLGTVWFVALATSVLLVKQHYVADAVTGTLLGLAIHALTAARWARSPEATAPPTTGTPGVLALLGFAFAIYAGAYALCALGVAPPSRIW